jgi:hypothetical protein
VTSTFLGRLLVRNSNRPQPLPSTSHPILSAHLSKIRR